MLKTSLQDNFIESAAKGSGLTMGLIRLRTPAWLCIDTSTNDLRDSQSCMQILCHGYNPRMLPLDIFNYLTPPRKFGMSL